MGENMKLSHRIIFWTSLAVIIVCSLIIAHDAFASSGYYGVGSKHWVSQNTDEGRTIILEDGSRWSICYDGVDETKNWSLKTDVVVVEESGDLCGYDIVNVETKTYVEATLSETHYASTNDYKTLSKEYNQVFADQLRHKIKKLHKGDVVKVDLKNGTTLLGKFEKFAKYDDTVWIMPIGKTFFFNDEAFYVIELSDINLIIVSKV